MYAPVVIGYDLQAAHDLVKINISIPHFLVNVFRAINSGWTFQREVFDMDSNTCKNHVEGSDGADE
jgi:hypothetical protein